jgi:2,3-bisphosphoglycerate-independent phosphoglycerate mutase
VATVFEIDASRERPWCDNVHSQGIQKSMTSSDVYLVRVDDRDADLGRIPMNKTYLVILCGAGDRPIGSLGMATPLEVAATPHLDRLAQDGAQGMVTVIDKEISPESDSGAMALLSYDPHEHYTGRGPLEGLGSGFLALGDNAVSFRINFASYDADRGRLDRRTARDLTDEQLQALVAEIRERVKLDGCEGVRFKLMGFGHHRGILCFSADTMPLSGRVSNTDPGFVNVGPFGVYAEAFEPKPCECIPLEEGAAAANTARAVNSFVRESARVLSESAVNKGRIARGELPANVILFRDGGNQPQAMQPFSRRFHRSLSFYGQVPAEKGLMELIGGRFSYCRPPEGGDEASYLEDTAATLLCDDADVVGVHLKGADEPSHDGAVSKKVSAIELIDRHFIRRLTEGLDPNDVCIVTSDHATPCELKIHSADAVPLLVRSPAVPRDATSCFSEREAAGGGLPFRRAVELLPYVFQCVEARA